MKKFTLFALFIVAILLFGSRISWGQLLVEDFNYSAGALLTGNGWTAHSSGGTNPITVSASSITYSGYLSSGVGNEVTLTTSGEDDSKGFTAQSSGNVYVSCLVSITSATTTGDYFLHVGAASMGTSFRGRVFVKRDASNNLAFGIAQSTSTANYTGFSYALNTTYLLVLKYSIVSGATNDVSAIYINPTLNAPEPTSGWTANTDASGTDPSDIGTVALRQGSATNAAALKLDGIRVSTSWSDIVGASGTPLLTLTPGTLSGFNYVIGGGPSTSQSYSLSGTYLTGFPGSITVTGSTNYEVSTDNTSFSGSVNVAYTSATLSSTTLYARLKAGLSIGTYNGELISHAGGGATTANLTCNGSVSSPGPSIVVGTLNSFGNQVINTTSAEQNYTVTGSNLTADIIVTPPAGFEISTGTGGGFVATNPITLTQTGGSVNATIYARFAPTLVQAYSGNITHTSTGAAQQDVAVSGTGVYPEPTNHVTNFDAGVATTTSIPLTWTDATGGTLPEGYLIKASTTSYNAITNPVDGTPVANSTLAQNVAYGVQTVTFTGLNSGSPYYFKIFPYTNSGAQINYLTTAPVPADSTFTVVVPETIIYEDFNYTPPAYVGGNGSAGSSSNNWTTHSGGGLTIDVQTGNLSYPGLAASQGYKILIPGNNSSVSRDINRALPTVNTSAVMYYSAIINIVDATQLTSLTTPDYFLHFGACSGSSCSIFGGRLGIVASNGFANFKLGVLNTSGGTPLYTYYADSSLNFGQSYFVVVKYDRSTTPTSAKLWVNPTSLGGSEPGTGFVANSTGTNTFSDFQSICIRNSTGTPKAEIDEIRIGTTWADVTPAGVPTLTTTPASLSGFLYFVGSGPSTSQSFTIDGTALTPSSGNLTVTGSANYEVSSDGTTFGATASLAYTSSTFTGLTAYVRLKAGLPVGNYNGELVTISGGGATSVTVSCSGAVAASAPIIVAGSLTGFGNQVINTPSAEQTYVVSGSYLTGNITITPPSGFEISLGTGGSFVATNPIVLVPTAGNVPNTNIYVRFVPTLLQAYSGNISHTSPGATTVNVAVSGIGIKGEPDNFPTLFATGTITQTTIQLTWTDATTGTFIPDGYIIKGSITGYSSIVDPVDGIAEPSAGLVQNVAQGVQTVTFTSLSPGGTYYFKIYPFTNSGTAINYKTFPVPPQATGTTNAPPPTTYTWNQTSAASYAVSTNWTPERTTPALNDILVVDGSLTPSATLNSIPTQTIGQFKVINSASATLQGSGIITLTIGGGTGEDLVVETGSTLSISGSSVLNLTIATGAAASISGNMSVAAAAHKFTAVDASGITFNSGAVFTTGTGFTGNPFGTTNYNSVIFSNGSSYIFTTGSNPFGASAPLSVVVFQTGSLYKHQSSGSPSFSGRTYANFELNFATANISATGPNATSIDNLTITLGTLSLNLTGDPGHSIKGNISVAPGATLNFNPASAGTFKLNGTSEQSITVNGTFSTGANSVLEIDNAAGVVLNSSISMSGGWKFTNGLLTLGSNNLTLGASSAITGTPSASSMIVATGSGELRKTFTAAGSFTYPVGDNDGTAEYSPVTLTFTSGSYASAYAGVNLVNAAYPGSTGNYLNRYWNVTSSGMSGFLCDALFSYNVSDVTGNENSLYCVMITPPTNYSPANTTLHQLTASGLTAFGTFTGRDPFSGDKTLNIKVFLEGLYAGGGLLNQANNEFGPQFPAGVADQVTIVLYDGIGLVYTINNVNLSTTGDISVTIPATYSATYYIGIKHRNSIETATASPISFAGSVISYDFTTSASQAFGSNLQNLQFSGVYGIFGGDENQDGLVDSSDMIDCDNDAAAFVVGYISTDVNGDGIIDSSDMILIDNNSTAFVATNLPY